MIDDVLRQASSQPCQRSTARRRPWLLSLGIGFICAIVAGLAVWWGVGEKYTASCDLLLDIQEKSLFEAAPQVVDREGFEIFKNTQQQMVVSRLVLMAALRKPEVAQIPNLIREAKRWENEADWLRRYVSVSFPGNAQYMEVSVTRPDAEEAAVLLNAVVDSYVTDAVAAERRVKQERLSKLENACAEKETQIRNTRKELKGLAELAGIGTGTEAMTQRQKIIIEEYSLRNQHKVRMEYELGELQAQVAAEEASLRNIDSTEPPAEEVEMLMRADPVTNQLSAELALKKQEEAVMSRAAVPSGSKNRDIERRSRELKLLQDQYDEKLAEAKKKVQDRRRVLVQSEATKLRNQFEVKRELYEKLAKDVEKLRVETQKFGSTTVDIEMLNSDLKQMDLMASQLNAEKEKIKVSLQSAPRITLVERAERPLEPSNIDTRLGITFVTMLIVFLGAAIIVILFDALTRRIKKANL
jgi:polysaccharide biosynthesis transport protein